MSAPRIKTVIGTLDSKDLADKAVLLMNRFCECADKQDGDDWPVSAVPGPKGRWTVVIESENGFVEQNQFELRGMVLGIVVALKSLPLVVETESVPNQPPSLRLHSHKEPRP